jgi:methyl-accepting chemotaxis protein
MGHRNSDFGFRNLKKREMMMAQGNRNRRRNYFVKKDYQIRFILKFCLLVLAGAVMSTGLLLLISRGTLTSSFEHSELVVTNTSRAILPAVILTNTITFALISLATIIVVLFISHKIAGPMLRFEKELKEIGQGDLTKKIRLRKKDQFNEIAEGLSSMTASLGEKVLTIQTELEQLMEAASKQKAPEGLIEGLNHLHQSISEQFRS